MATQVGTGQNFSLSGFLLDLESGVTYLATMNWQSVSVATNGEWEEVSGKDGEINSVIASGDYLEAQCEAIPQGATIAGAAATAKIPPRGTAFDAKDFGTAKIPIGPFTNSGICSADGSVVTGVTDVSPWLLYSATLNATNTGKWTISMTLRRYKNITTGTAIS